MEDNNIKENIEDWFVSTDKFVQSFGSLIDTMKNSLTDEQKSMVDKEMSKLDLSELKSAMSNLSNEINKTITNK